MKRVRQYTSRWYHPHYLDRKLTGAVVKGIQEGKQSADGKDVVVLMKDHRDGLSIAKRMNDVYSSGLVRI